MKSLLRIIFYFIGVSAFGQNIDKQMETVTTVAQADAFIKSNTNLDAQLLTISSDKDTSDINKKLFLKNLGDIFPDDNFTYKIIESVNALSFRVSYIYLDGNKLSLQSIDSLRKIILHKYKNGISFLDLVKEYNMDSNKKGDLGWFTEGMMMKEFEMAVRSHKLNDIFTIDIPSKKWHYVTLKTFDDKNIKTLIILKVKNST